MAALALGWPRLRRWLPDADLLPPGSEQFIDVGPLQGFMAGQPTAVHLTLPDAPARARPVVFVLGSPEGAWRVFSSVCPHRACVVEYRAEEAGFRCGCHDSRFDAAGRRQSGPAPRDLDPLPHRVEAGRLLVQWKRYRPGTPESVEG